MALTGRRRLFCIEYLKDFNASAAAIRAGYSTEASRQIGSRLLTKDDIKEEIVRIRDEVLGDKKDNLKYMVLQKLEKIANANITDVITVTDDSVHVQNTDDLDEDTKECILEISQTASRNGLSIGVKMESKIEALKMLGKYAGLFDDRLELSGKVDSETSLIDDRLAAFRELKQKAKDTINGQTGSIDDTDDN